VILVNPPLCSCVSITLPARITIPLVLKRGVERPRTVLCFRSGYKTDKLLDVLNRDSRFRRFAERLCVPMRWMGHCDILISSNTTTPSVTWSTTARTCIGVPFSVKWSAGYADFNTNPSAVMSPCRDSLNFKKYRSVQS
jgi:hypothetical protein